MKNSIEFITDKSKELLDRQIAAFLHIDQNAGIIVGIVSIFLPLFVGSIVTENIIIKLISLIPIVVFVVGIVVMLLVIRSKKLNLGYSEKEIEELIDEPIKNILKIEIAYNVIAYEENEDIIINKNSLYNFGLIILIIAIILSVVMMIVNIFMK